MATVTESRLSSRSNGNAMASSLSGAKSPAASTGADASPASPEFHDIRRAVTVDDGGPSGYCPRVRPPSGEFNPRFAFDGDRRRSSTFSDYSFSDAKRNLHEDILNPAGVGFETAVENRWTWVPLLFALMPALGGMVHKNGATFMSDIMLLGLAGVFLNWSVTQPWVWYQSAQEVRAREEMGVEMGLEEVDGDDMGDTSPTSTPRKAKGLNDVPEEEPPARHDLDKADRGRIARRALSELYLHEVAALLMAFVAPLLAAGILHMVRTQLSRPSEGWVSNFHLTVFCLAAEITPLGHAIKLVRARTLHLQRIVHSNPYCEDKISATQVQELAKRLEELEARMVTVSETATTAALTTGDNRACAAELQRQQATVARNVRDSVQPELDALNRAVRRYEKKATVLASLTEARLGALDSRLNDAISLAAAATKAKPSQWNLYASLGKAVADWMIRILLLPIYALFTLCILPLKTLALFLGVKERSREDLGFSARPGSGRRSDRLSKGVPPDRMPSRLSRK